MTTVPGMDPADYARSDHANQSSHPDDIPVLHAIAMPTNQVRSGMITARGLILRVDRCAPEHGGGLLCWLAGDRQMPVESGADVMIFGWVNATDLDHARYAERMFSSVDMAGGHR